MKTTFPCLLALLAAWALASSAPAASVTLTNSDGSSNPSFTTAGCWSDGQAPSSANDYFTAGFMIRTPMVSSPSSNYFFGKSLSVDTGGTFQPRYTVPGNVTIPDLRLNGGTVKLGILNTSCTLWGNLAVNADSYLHLYWYTNSFLVFNSAISGAGNLAIQGVMASGVSVGSGVQLLGDNSAYSGTWSVSDGGFLLVGNGGTSGSLGSGNISLNGTAALSINRAGTLTVPGVISGNGSLTLLGPGTVILEGGNTYGGDTTIKAGTLKLGQYASLTGSRNLTVASGATLDVSSVVGGFILGYVQSLGGSGAVVGNFIEYGGGSILPGGSSVAGTLTFSNDVAFNGDTLVFDLSSANTIGSGVNDLIVVNGNLTLGSNPLIINPLGLLAGTYRLINYTGTKTGSLNPVVQGTRYTCTIDESTPGQINLVVSGTPASLLWTGQSGSGWDLQSTPSWDHAGVPDTFYNGDNVTFDDTAFTSTVDLSTALAPAAITVTTLNTYTFDGPGALVGGGSLTKDGTGTLILDNAGANTFSSATTIKAGTLQVGNYDKNGSLGTGPVTNNGTLLVTRQDALTLAGPLSGTGSLTFLGTNATVTLAGHSTFTGRILSGSILKISSEDALGADPATFSATQLALGNFVSGNPAACLTNGGLEATTSFTIASLNRGIYVPYAGTYMPRPNFIVDAGATLTVASPISGSTVTKWGPGTLVLTGTNTFNGQLEIDRTVSDIDDGAVRLTSSANVPAAASCIAILNGGNGKSVLQLDGSAGSILIPKLTWSSAPGIRMSHRTASDPHLQNLAGSNTILAPLFLLGNGTVQSDSGVLNLAGSITMDYQAGTGNQRNLTFTGSGDFLVSNVITNNRSCTIRLIKNGAGTLTLASTCALTGTTTNNAGTLLVTGMLGTDPAFLTNTVAVVGGTLGGNGTINAPVIVQTGARLAPGPGIGTLTISNALTLNSGSTTLVEVNAGTGACDSVQGLPSISYGGTLVVSNLAGTVTANRDFQLFSAASRTGNFSSFTFPQDASQTWSFNPTNGMLSVRLLVNTTPTNLTSVINGNTLTLSWPADHLGWAVQAQTNPPGVGLGSHWVTMPGSASTNQLFLPIDPAQGSVFYRLVYPGQ